MTVLAFAVVMLVLLWIMSSDMSTTSKFFELLVKIGSLSLPALVTAVAGLSWVFEKIQPCYDQATGLNCSGRPDLSPETWGWMFIAGTLVCLLQIFLIARKGGLSKILDQIF